MGVRDIQKIQINLKHMQNKSAVSTMNQKLNPERLCSKNKKNEGDKQSQVPRCAATLIMISGH